MDLNLFENLKKHIESNDVINNFIEELGNFLKNANSQENNVNEVSKNTNSLSDSRNQNLAQNRKEGHLYLITEDMNYILHMVMICYLKKIIILKMKNKYNYTSIF